MKSAKLLVSIIFIYVLIVLPSCKGKGEDPGPEETEAQRITALLTSSSWKLKSVTVDGVAKNMFTNMGITFTSSTFSATNGSPVWPSSGTWTFNDDTAKSFKRDDQTTVSIDAIDANNLTLSLDWTKTTVGPGRSQSVAGKHVFVLGK
ncbi:MAG TPA: hypothetical protein VFE50_24510 [Cyclobacteriaceae bacterium]|nr:hypothetical protein [Cyclobacteriaceae bacterium]